MLSSKYDSFVKKIFCRHYNVILMNLLYGIMSINRYITYDKDMMNYYVMILDVNYYGKLIRQF